MNASGPTISRTTTDDGIAVLVFDDPSRSANVLNAITMRDLDREISRLEDEVEALAGVVLTSNKSTFVAGGDIHEMYSYTKGDERDFSEYIARTKVTFRRLEKLPVPVAAVLNGAALGGGLELALCCNHRVAVDGAFFALPEVTFGLLPGGGGITRTVRLLGLDTALDQLLLSGARISASEAVAMGIVDDVAASVEDAFDRARSWILSTPSWEQPWDRGESMPGSTPHDPAYAVTMGARAATLRARTHGAPAAAQRAILAAAVEGSLVNFDVAQTIESRYFVELVVAQTSKNMIKGKFLDLNRVNAGLARPAGYGVRKVQRVAVLGAGLMGSGIAFACARAGIDVLLKDRNADLAAQGKAAVEKIVTRLVNAGQSSETDGAAILARISPVETAAELAGCDVVIEAVSENPALKSAVFDEVEAVLVGGALMATNTSSLPITGLAETRRHPADFIGMHFFSPVDKMKLVEIVVGRETSPETTARAFDFARQLGKTPIIVNDARGFFTSRVMEAYLLEAVAMLGEGIAPLSIERAAQQAGYRMPPLQLMDVLSLDLLNEVHVQTEEAYRNEGKLDAPHPAGAVLDTFVRAGRTGRASGAGFYDYEEGRRVRPWPEIDRLYTRAAVTSIEHVKDRFLFAQAIETLRCIDEGVLTTVEDANVGSLLGIGYPEWTGGTVQFAMGYEGGLPAFQTRAKELTVLHGSRFALPTDDVGALIDGLTVKAS